MRNVLWTTNRGWAGLWLLTAACSPGMDAGASHDPVSANRAAAGSGTVSAARGAAPMTAAAPVPSAGRPAVAPSSAGSAGMTSAVVAPPPRPAQTAAAGADVPTAPVGAAGQPAAPSGMGMGMGMAPPVGTMDPSSCPAPPAGTSADAIAALNAVNKVRLKTGAGCMSQAPALSMSATSHCNYNATNASMSMCQPGGHSEVMSCMGFTGADVQARVKAAGYSGLAGVTEVLTQGGTPEQAVMGWVDTLWHRIPVLDPWTTDMGYGTATGCRVIDFGRGMTPAAKELVTVYPYDGQTDFPTSFNGLESPQPPMPSTGWPSGSFISVFAQNIQVTDHVLTLDSDPTPIEHIWIDKNSSTVMAGYRGYLSVVAFMYANKPLSPNTKYRAKVTGMHTGGTFNLEWTFTTGAGKR